MKKPNFTAGPWERGTSPKPRGMNLMIYCDDALGSRIADCSTSGHGISNEQDEANAKLIAASPLLAEALADMLGGWRYIRRNHGDLYGVGWDRAETAAIEALRAAGYEVEQP